VLDILVHDHIIIGENRFFQLPGGGADALIFKGRFRRGVFKTIPSSLHSGGKTGRASLSISRKCSV